MPVFYPLVGENPGSTSVKPSSSPVPTPPVKNSEKQGSSTDKGRERELRAETDENRPPDDVTADTDSESGICCMAQNAQGLNTAPSCT